MAESPRAAGEDEPFSIGAYLKSQRKIRGIGLDELAVRTRIPLRSLTRLEQGAFDGDPDGFVRGFVRTVSDGLGLDPDDTLMRMLAEPDGARAVGARARLPVRVWLGVAVGLLAALAGVTLLHAALWDGPEVVRTTVVIRRDPVRALAEAHAASRVEPPAPAAATDRSSQAAPTRVLPDVSAPAPD